MISELIVRDVELPLDDGRIVHVNIDPYRVIWNKEERKHELICWPTDEKRLSSPKEMLTLLKVARERVDKTLEWIHTNQYTATRSI
jgi:hypothetical protein